MKRLCLVILMTALLLFSCEEAQKTTEMSQATDTVQATETTEIITTAETAPAITYGYADFTPDEGTVQRKYYEDVAYGYDVTEYATPLGENIYWVIRTWSGQVFRYDLDENVYLTPSMHEIACFEDVNFDKRPDLCIYMGSFGVQGAQYCQVYLRDSDMSYQKCEGFENISNPALDKENEVILSTSRINAAEHSYKKYAVKDNAVQELDSIVYSAADDTVTRDSVTYPVSDFADWNIFSAKWNEFLCKTNYKYIDEYEHPKYTVLEYCDSDRGMLRFEIFTNSKEPQNFSYYTAVSGGSPAAERLVTLDDVNFDGITDMCIFKGLLGNSSAVRYIAYLGNGDGTYTYCGGFDNIASPVLDREKKQILSVYNEGANNSWYEKYVFENGEFVITDSLYRDFGEETVYHNGTLHSIAYGTEGYDTYISEKGDWMLDSEKWTDIVASSEVIEYLDMAFGK